MKHELIGLTKKVSDGFSACAPQQRRPRRIEKKKLSEKEIQSKKRRGLSSHRGNTDHRNCHLWSFFLLKKGYKYSLIFECSIAFENLKKKKVAKEVFQFFAKTQVCKKTQVRRGQW
ncbi:hypothetical protein, unlikely [Trypanosoma brucei brucei TREU927]|uniref:Uncharacterized protein n=1 Tax=Trypanosoma brucei brucei (strain 927/4 GUTat10.1) TaxID=185431 RepID=Q38DA2_TRYB2|nr:hypothetical protein, unlikely [Trypanosoma brucei brucei TREU927]EAN77218.1 hypothetical protein, unlikely [Trypanosoma brucei brucei TREU927]